MNSSTPIDQLNPAQRDAVRASATHQLILAGAGSGKTQVLVHRIAWLIQRHQVPPHAILAVTFTNKAAREMRERIETLLGHDIRQMWVGTFHGLAHRLLRLHWHDAGLAEDFQILDSDDQQRLIKRTLRELGLNEEQWPARQAQWFINAQKDEGIRPNRIEPQGDRQLATLVEIYQAYEAACQRANVIDFAELLLRAHELWLNHPELLHHYQNRFRHLLVDEFQDTNSIQYAWIRLLAGGGARVTAVGDDDQSIYGWRGARIENIHRFSRDFADVQTVRLEQNYRSTATILDAANAVIARNRERLGKALWTDGSPGEPIALYTAYNEEDEARFVVGQIRQQLAQGLACREIAILYRSNAQSRLLEEALLRAGIAYRIHGGQRFYERLEIKNALAYLRLMLNRHDDTSLERVLTAPPRGIGGKTLELLRSEARGQQWSLWRAMQQMVTARALPARALTALAAFTQNIDELDRATRDLALSQRVEQVIQRSGLIEFHASERGEKGRGRVENLQELVSASGQFSELLRSEDETLLATAAHDELALLLDSVALEADLQQQLGLLLDGLREAGEEDLVVAQAGGTCTLAGTSRKVPRIVGVIALEFGQLGLMLGHSLLDRRELLGLLAFALVDDAAGRGQSFAPGHCLPSLRGMTSASSASTAASSRRLVGKSTCSNMSCCRKRCRRGHSAMAASTRGSLPRWYAPIAMRSRWCW